MSVINLQKGQSAVSLRKTASLRVEASWPAATDYDLYALVLNRDGTVVHVANFGATGIPAQPAYKGVKLSPDAGRIPGGGTSTETLTVNFDDSIAAVVPVAYSAQSNGTGSFRRYQVTLNVDNGAGEQVEMAASNASDNDHVYTCVPAVIINNADGTVSIDPVELYSRGGENRPDVAFKKVGVFGKETRVVVEMDAGPRNNYK